MGVKKISLDEAIRRYNGIMNSIGYEHNTIGTPFSEHTEGWNLRDMVAEADYTLSTYYEDGHANAEMRRSREPDERAYWRSETGRLKRFISTYAPHIVGMQATTGHCSQYD